MLSNQSLSVCVIGAGVISLLLQIVGFATSGWIAVSFTTTNDAINSSASTDGKTTNGLVNTELPGMTDGPGTPPSGVVSERPIDNGGVPIPTFGANRGSTATGGRIPHKKPVNDDGIPRFGHNDRVHSGQSNAPIDNGGLTTPRPDDNQSLRRKTRADHPNVPKDNGGVPNSASRNEVWVSTPSPQHEPTSVPVSTTRGNMLTRPVFRHGRPTGPIDNGGVPTARPTSENSMRPQVRPAFKPPQTANSGVPRPTPVATTSQSNKPTDKNKRTIVNRQTRTLPRITESSTPTQDVDTPPQQKVSVPFGRMWPNINTERPKMTTQNFSPHIISWQYWNINVGIWTISVCVGKTVENSECTVRPMEKLYTNFQLDEKTSSNVHINDLASVATLNDLRVENTFALIVAVVGVVNVFLSVKPLCLKDPRRVTVIIAMCALSLSGVLVLTSIIRLAGIYKAVKMSAFAESSVGFRTNTPYSAIVSGCGGFLAVITAGLLALYGWMKKKGKWQNFDDNSHVFYQTDAEEQKDARGNTNAAHEFSA